MNKFRGFNLVALFLVIIITFSSCMTTRTNIGDYKQEDGVSYTYAKGKQLYLFWGLMPLGRTNLVAPLNRTCQVRTSYNFWDALVTTLTGGIFTMQTISIKTKRELGDKNIGLDAKKLKRSAGEAESGDDD